MITKLTMQWVLTCYIAHLGTQLQSKLLHKTGGPKNTYLFQGRVRKFWGKVPTFLGLEFLKVFPWVLSFFALSFLRSRRKACTAITAGSINLKVYVFSDDRACNERKFQETAASVEVASQQQPPSQVTDQTSTVIGHQGIVQPLIQFEGMNLKQVSFNI